MERCLSEDRIGELPEDLRLRILSSLKTKDVIATSLLSKRWRSLWKMMLRPKFVYPDLENNGSHKVRDTCDDSYTGSWSWNEIAYARHVREFELYVYLYLGVSKLHFPCNLFSSDTIETLEIKMPSIHIDVPCTFSMKSLRTLHLKDVKYKDDESVCNLLSGCPNLEDLLVYRRYPNKAMNFNIVSPSLKRLSIQDDTIATAGGYVIKAPSLEYLSIEGIRGYEHCLIENMPELVEASILNVFRIANEKIMGSFKSAKRLSLDLSPLGVKYPTGLIFYQLVYLEFHTHRDEWCNLLSLMLDSSPKLQVLKLINHHCPQEEYCRFSQSHSFVGEEWSEPKYVPRCLWSYLETFVWTKYDWRREDDNKVATYILKNAMQLKKAIFSIRPTQRLKELEVRPEKLKELNRIVRSSNSCHLLFEYE